MIILDPCIWTPSVSQAEKVGKDKEKTDACVYTAIKWVANPAQDVSDQVRG